MKGRQGGASSTFIYMGKQKVIWASACAPVGRATL